MKEAINAYRQITVSPELQEAERLRSKARHDEAQALWNAEQRSRAEERIMIARNLLHKQMLIDDIVDVTGLTREEIENLNNEN